MVRTQSKPKAQCNEACSQGDQADSEAAAIHEIRHDSTEKQRR
jgi:hypothetical protein